MRSRWLYALFGVVSTLVGMALGHLAAALLNPDSSPVLAVGAAIIELTPQPVASWAIEQFGSADKVILIGSVMIGVLVLAAVAGLLALRRFAAGAGLLVLLVAVAGVAVFSRPQVAVLDVIPVVLTAVVGVTALWVLHRTASGMSLNPRAASTAAKAKAEAARPGSDGSGETGDVSVIAREQDDEDKPAGATRRSVLIVTATLTAAAAVMGGAGRFIGGLRARPEDVTLPMPASGEAAPALPQDLSQQYQGITPLQIDNAEFYRVDTRLDVPVISTDGWTLTVDGDVENELEISFDELLDMPMIERDITLTCVSNPVGGEYAGGARWLGVRLQDVLDMAGVGDSADQILSTDFDGMTISTPLDLATDGRDAMIAIAMNGNPLPREHGFPVRMVVPGLYGFISATKWLTRLTLTTYAEEESYWTQRNWDTRAPIKPSARIDTPRSFDEVGGRNPFVGGVAWAQNDGGVSTVQVRIDGGGWVDAEVGPDVNNVYWRQWYYELPADLGSGTHSVSARVMDGAGETQTDVRAQPFPGGSSGLHTVQFRVA